MAEAAPLETVTTHHIKRDFKESLTPTGLQTASPTLNSLLSSLRPVGITPAVTEQVGAVNCSGDLEASWETWTLDGEVIAIEGIEVAGLFDCDTTDQIACAVLMEGEIYPDPVTGVDNGGVSDCIVFSSPPAGSSPDNYAFSYGAVLDVNTGLSADFWAILHSNTELYVEFHINIKRNSL